MPASAYFPDVVVEIAFDSGYATPAASRTWTDVSAYVEAQFGIHIQRGRSDELSDVEPSQLTLTLDNKDGRFTPDYSSGAYYPNVRLGRPIRVSATWPLGGGGTTYRRFTGYVVDWPVQWPDGSQAMAHATVTASSRMARLGRLAELRNVVAEEVLYDAPVMYYPLAEAQGSTSAGNASTTPYGALAITQAGSGGTLTFASGTGPGTDGQGAVTFDRADSSNGKYLAGVRPATPVATGSTAHFALECWISSTAVSQAPVSFGVGGGGGPRQVAVTIDAGGNLNAGTVSAGSLSEIMFGPHVTDGEQHHVALKLDKNGSNFDAVLMVDGVTVSTLASFVTAADMDAVGAGSLTVGDLRGSLHLVLDAVVSHVAVYSGATDVTTARFAQHWLAGSTGFEGESTDDRIQRIARWVGVPTAEVSAEAGSTDSMAFGDTTGKAPMTAMLDVAHTEGGLLFDAGDGTLTFHSRAHRYNAVSQLTLNGTAQQIESDLEPRVDTAGLLNDVTVTIPSGYSVRATDQTSIDENGLYRESVDLLTTSTLEADDAANHMVGSYADPIVRVAAASVQVIVQDTTTVGNLLAVDLGDLVTLASLPSQAPDSADRFFVEGYTEVIGSEGQGWTWTANLSPELATQGVWTIGDAVYGAYDSNPLAY